MLDTYGNVETDDGSNLTLGTCSGADAGPSIILSQSVDNEDGFAEFRLRVVCNSVVAELELSGTGSTWWASSRSTGVSYSVDSGPVTHEAWATFLPDAGTILHSPDHDATVLQSWRNGQALTVTFTLHAAPPYTRQVDLAAIFSTPVQSAMDVCLAKSGS